MRYISKPNIDFPYEETIKSISILPIFDNCVKVYKPILHVRWTLAFEWFFYLIFGGLILFKIQNKQFFLIIIFSLLTFLGYVFPNNNLQFDFINNPIVLEFCMGVLIAKYFNKRGITKHFSMFIFFIVILFYIIIIFLGFGVHAEGNSNNFQIYYWQRFFIWGIPSSLIVFGAVNIEKNTMNYFNSRVLLLLGNASFAIYLVHTMFISLVNKFYILIKFIPLDLIILFFVIMSVLLGIIYHVIIEKSLSKYFNQLLFNIEEIKI